MQPNLWYLIIADVSLADAWTVTHAMNKTLLQASVIPALLKAYLDLTVKINIALAGLLPNRTQARVFTLARFLANSSAEKLGEIDVPSRQDYTTTCEYLFNESGNFLARKASIYGISEVAVPIYLSMRSNGILGRVDIVWLEPISLQVFTLAFEMDQVVSTFGPRAFVEKTMSSIDYHEGLQHVAQHWTPAIANFAYNASCDFDEDCADEFPVKALDISRCSVTMRCNPRITKGSSGLAAPIPGIYFNSPKGQAGPGSSILTFFDGQFSLMDMRSAERLIRLATYKGPVTTEGYDFAGWLSLDMFQLAHWHRRLENCNYTGGKNLSDGVMDAQGWDCNDVKNTLAVKPLSGAALYYTLHWHWLLPASWDPELCNQWAGSWSYYLQERVNMVYCYGNTDCDIKDVSKFIFAQIGYEPQFGVTVDLNNFLGFSWLYTPTTMHPQLSVAKKIQLPILVMRVSLHLPGSFNMALSQAQSIPGILNGLYFVFAGFCMLSITGGIACCVCGV